MHGATSWNAVGSKPDMFNEFSSIYLILPAALCLGFTPPVTVMSTRDRNINISDEWPAAGM
jgi:hypothetical protein